jgi:hypothetical protein
LKDDALLPSMPNKEDTEVEWFANDPRGTKIATGKAKLNEFGTSFFSLLVFFPFV